MRGPLPGVPAMLQPVGHALLQATEEVESALEGFDETYLWTKPAGMASVGFHLRHITGVVDRLFTYAKASALSSPQFDYLTNEGIANNDNVLTLVDRFKEQVQRAITQLQQTPETELLAARGIGRKQIPTNTIGLLFHAAEHTQRHVGQLLVTVKWIQSGQNNS